jgi:hypothetical protein
LEQLFKHRLKIRGLEEFLKDWEKARGMPEDSIGPADARHPGH